MKYYRHYHDELEPEECTEIEAMRSISTNYDNSQDVLAATTKDHPVKTPNCLVWQE